MAVEDTLAERGARYGQFINHAEIAQGLQAVLHKAPNWPTLDYDMRQALVVITDKIARILNGDPYYDDNWHDIQGYAKLVEDRIKELNAAKQEQASEPPIETTPVFVPFFNGAWDNPLLTGTAVLSPTESTTYTYDKSEDPHTDVGNYRG